MDNQVKQNALLTVAKACKAEMESVNGLDARRQVIDRHLMPLTVKFGIQKPELLSKIYRITHKKDE